jgi:hypothetical protein
VAAVGADGAGGVLAITSPSGTVPHRIYTIATAWAMNASKPGECALARR